MWRQWRSYDMTKSMSGGRTFGAKVESQEQTLPFRFVLKKPTLSASTGRVGRPSTVDSLSLSSLDNFKSNSKEN
jgi:hypothetical protein